MGCLQVLFRVLLEQVIVQVSTRIVDSVLRRIFRR
jgi:hypothetical protein